MSVFSEDELRLRDRCMKGFITTVVAAFTAARSPMSLPAGAICSLTLDGVKALNGGGPTQT